MNERKNEFFMDDKNRLSRIIEYWVDVELSSPPIIKTNNATKKSDAKWHQKIGFKNEDDVIWMSPLKEKIDEPQDWVHRIYLGVFSTEIVIEEFSKDNSDVNELKGRHNTCLISFLLDGDGLPIKDTVMVPEYLSYIAYAKTEDKSLYRSFEERVKDIFATWAYTIKKNKNCVDKQDMHELIRQILLELNWALLAESYMNNQFLYLGYTESLSINKNRSLKFDSEINHSLIANDLKKVKENVEQTIPESALFHYLNNDYSTINKNDVLSDIEFLKQGLSPSQMTNVAWPVNEQQKLVSSQQFAVNKIINEMGQENTGIFSVNGPPGTGKTTLLREVIANIVYERALKLYEFKDCPEKAFEPLGDITFKFNDKGHKTIYGLNSELSGYEMVVASSNNGAVQNITKELPLKEDIDSKWHNDFQYLKEVATNMNNGAESWGALAATLGNKNNNYNFISNFLFSNTDDEGDTTRSIFDFLKSPQYFSGENVLSWDVACQKFEQQRKKVESLKNEIESLRYGLENYQQHYKKAQDLEKAFKQSQTTVKDIQEKIKDCQSQYKEQKRQLQQEYEAYKKGQTRSKMLLNKVLRKDPEKEHSLNVESYKKQMNELKRQYARLQKQKEKALEDYEASKSVYKTQLELINQLKQIHNNYGAKINPEIPNDSFWQQDKKEVQRSAPWLSDRLLEEKINLFMASLELHKSFMIENSEIISSNLYCLKDVLNNEFHEKDIYAKAIWQTLFMVVPVLSTTFSSLGNLFESIKGGDLGWLLVDEGGQSTPQAPVGGMWRCKKAVVVGDPLQVEPIVTVEKKLSDVLLDKNDVSLDWNTCNYSAQQVADRNNPWGTNIKLGKRNVWVGAPLRVHRRCGEPMFSIANTIAYNDMMIFGKSTANDTTSVQEQLGKSRWVSIKGEAAKNSHWVKEEGEQLITMLQELMTLQNNEDPYSLPDFYVISPFKNVAFETTRMLKKRQNEWVGNTKVDEKDISSWLNRSIGTIHAFQGKEARTVFLVLGGNIVKPGAITWACEEPNILNVATTRARENFYLLGNPNVWNKGVFGLLKDLIEIDKSHSTNNQDNDKPSKENDAKSIDEDDDLKDFMDEDLDL